MPSTTKVKLCDADIVVLGCGGVVPNGLQVKIYVNDQTGFEKGNDVKQQILENDEIVNRLQKYHFTLLRNQAAIERSPGGIDKMINRTTVLKHIEEILGEPQK